MLSLITNCHTFYYKVSSENRVVHIILFRVTCCSGTLQLMYNYSAPLNEQNSQTVLSSFSLLVLNREGSENLHCYIAGVFPSRAHTLIS